jgi:hypothetical protein
MIRNSSFDNLVSDKHISYRRYTFYYTCLRLSKGKMQAAARRATGKLALDCAVGHPGVLREGGAIDLSLHL